MDTIFNIKFEDFEKSELFSGYAYDVSNETIDPLLLPGISPLYFSYEWNT